MSQMCIYYAYEHSKQQYHLQTLVLIHSPSLSLFVALSVCIYACLKGEKLSGAECNVCTILKKKKKEL